MSSKKIEKNGRQREGRDRSTMGMGDVVTNTSIYYWYVPPKGRSTLNEIYTGLTNIMHYIHVVYSSTERNNGD
jgi:hypothetical protein